jgi:hypothetical protein
MGQAKRRGTFEERKNQSISRVKQEWDEKRKQEAERWNALTPEQQEAETSRRERMMDRMRTLSMWTGYMGYFPYFR